MGKSIKRAKRDTVKGRKKLRGKNASRVSMVEVRRQANELLKFKNKGAL